MKIDKQITEWCSKCCNEVTIDAVFTPQICPICKETILPCSMCDIDNVDCSKCILE